MIAPKHNDCVLFKFQLLQRIEQPPNQSVNVADTRVVAVSQLLHFFFGEFCVLGDVLVAFEFSPAARRKFRRVLRMLRARRQRDFGSIVQVPVLFRRTEWQVRFAKTNCEKERLLFVVEGFQRFDCVVADHAIGVLFVRYVGSFCGGSF